MILIDFSNLLKRGVFANKDEIKENPSYLFHVVCTMILNVNDMFGASRQNPVVIAVDTKPSWRNSYYVENSKDFPEYQNQTYKGNRVPDTTIDWNIISIISNEILETLKSYSDFYIVEVPLCEADDIIAILAKDCLKRKEMCWIISMDHDFKQLQHYPYINLYDPIKKIVLPQFDSKRYLKLHCMSAGDDNIKQIAPKMGKKTKTAERTVDVLEEFLALNPEAKKRYKFNETLINFEKIPLDIQENINEELLKQTFSFDFLKLSKVFSKYSMANINERISKFKLLDVPVVTKHNTMHMLVEKKQEYMNSTLINFFD